MGEELAQLITDVEGEVVSSSLTDQSKHTAVWCVRQLPALYDKFRGTSESRYGDQITRLVRATLQTLVDGTGNSPASRELAVSIPARLQSLHQRFGIPSLKLDPPAAPVRARSRAAR
jgi:hypothetical protein